MPLIIKQDESHFEPAPPGLHSAVCCDVVDLDTTYDNPTPPSGVWQAESDQHARRVEMKEGR